jgi:hypothetical protein
LKVWLCIQMIFVKPPCSCAFARKPAFSLRVYTGRIIKNRAKSKHYQY